MAITALPTPPSRDDAADFSTRADDFLGALPLFGAQLNDVAGQIDADAQAASAAAASAIASPTTFASSTTQLTVTDAVQNLVVQADKNFFVGQFVTIARTSAPGTWIAGQITAYNSATGALSVAAIAYAGGGQASDWTVGLSSPMQFTPASVTQLMAGLLNSVGLTPANVTQAIAWQTIDYAATIVPSAASGFNLRVTLAGGITIGNPTGLLDGEVVALQLIQDATGGRVPSFGSKWNFGQAGLPSFSTIAGKRDVVIGQYDAAADFLIASAVVGF